MSFSLLSSKGKRKNTYYVFNLFCLHFGNEFFCKYIVRIRECE